MTPYLCGLFFVLGMLAGAIWNSVVQAKRSIVAGTPRLCEEGEHQWNKWARVYSEWREYRECIRCGKSVHRAVEQVKPE